MWSWIWFLLCHILWSYLFLDKYLLSKQDAILSIEAHLCCSWDSPFCDEMYDVMIKYVPNAFAVPCHDNELIMMYYMLLLL